MKMLAVIPARGGSKGIPKKNIKPLNGKPLIFYTIDAAREVFADDQILVSTDDEEIKQVVEDYGLKVPFLRPAELATDEAGTHEVLTHAITYYEAKYGPVDIVVLLQPTSPLRRGRHIKDALRFYDDSCDMVVSVKETKANPYYTLVEENKDGWLEKSKEGTFTRRQDCPSVYEINGAIYIMKADLIKSKKIDQISKSRKYLMSTIHSSDLDVIEDWNLCELILKEGLDLNENS